MTATIERPEAAARVQHPRPRPGQTFYSWITTTVKINKRKLTEYGYHIADKTNQQ